MTWYYIYTGPLSVQAQYSRSCSIFRSFCYNDRLVTWTVFALSQSQSQSQSQSYITTDGSVGQSVLVSSTHLGLTTRFLFLSGSCGFIDVGSSLSDERTGLPFTIAAGPRQRSHTWVRVPRDSWPYFTINSKSQSHIATDGRSISKSWCRAPDQIFIILRLVFTSSRL
jgi:hypothetical protein